MVDTLPNLEKMMSGGESASEGESCISEASGRESREEEQSEIGLPAMCAVVPQQNDLQESDHPELELYAMVARPVTKAERLVNLKANSRTRSSGRSRRSCRDRRGSESVWRGRPRGSDLRHTRFTFLCHVGSHFFGRGPSVRVPVYICIGQFQCRLSS